MLGTAVLLQDRCGLPLKTLAYDINFGCSGHPYALFVAHGYLLLGMKRVYSMNNLIKNKIISLIN